MRLLVPVLMVIAVGGLGSLTGSLVGALLLGIIDTFGRYYMPTVGAFVIYFAVVVSCCCGLTAYWACLPMDPCQETSPATSRATRLSWLDLLPFALIIVMYFVAESYLPLCTQIMIMIVFALSLDLILG